MTPPTDLSTDSALLRRVEGDGDAWAWREFHARYAKLIRGYSLRKGVPRSDCDDVVQDVFTRLLRCMRLFRYDRTRGRFRSFLCTLTARAVADRRRAEVRVAKACRREGDRTARRPDPDWEAAWRAWHMGRAMRTAEREFRGDQFEAFRRYALEGSPPERVAQSLGLTVGQVYTARSRILRRLAELVRAQIGAER